MSEEGPATHVDLTEVTRHLNEAFNTSEAATTGPAIGDVIAELQRRRSSAESRKRTAKPLSGFPWRSVSKFVDGPCRFGCDEPAVESCHAQSFTKSQGTQNWRLRRRRLEAAYMNERIRRIEQIVLMHKECSQQKKRGEPTPSGYLQHSPEDARPRTPILHKATSHLPLMPKTCRRGRFAGKGHNDNMD